MEPQSLGSTAVPVFSNLAGGLDVVLRRFYMILTGMRYANPYIANVSCKERWTGTVRLETSVGSLKCWLEFKDGASRTTGYASRIGFRKSLPAIILRSGLCT